MDEPEPEAEPEPEPEAEEESGGIPEFSFTSILIGLIVSALVVTYMRNQCSTFFIKLCEIEKKIL